MLQQRNVNMNKRNNKDLATTAHGIRIIKLSLPTIFHNTGQESGSKSQVRLWPYPEPNCWPKDQVLSLAWGVCTLQTATSWILWINEITKIWPRQRMASG